MVVKVRVEPPSIAPQLSARMDRRMKQIHGAIMQAAESTSKLILERGRADISGAGQFGTRWTTGLTAPVKQEEKGGATISVRQAVNYWRVFEYGHITRGKPLLWIPLSFSDAVGKRAANYPGGLFRVNRKSGAPLLLSRADRKPKFFGKAQVRIPKKFHIVQITHSIANELGQLFRVHMRASG